MSRLSRQNASNNNPVIKRNKWIKVRLSEAEFIYIHNLSIKTGLSISYLIRSRLLMSDEENQLIINVLPDKSDDEISISS